MRSGLLTQKGKDISQALSGLLGQPAFETELNKITGTAYEYFSTGAKSPTTIDVKPIANMALAATLPKWIRNLPISRRKLGS
jgi:hypothetical protein